MSKEYDYKLALYRRNNKGQPCFWICGMKDYQTVFIKHGIVGKTIITDEYVTDRPIDEEIQSRITAKRKTGYKYISELRDSTTLPVEGYLYDYLNTYLDGFRTTIDNSLLPMLAKVYDNTNNKVFNKCSSYYGQWKINGLRCFVSAYINDGDLFRPVRLKFQSREGTIWNTLEELEDYLLSAIPQDILVKMIDNNYILDGEIYLPGHSVNEINHFVKDATCQENKLLQYWCYDIAIANTPQYKRIDFLNDYLNKYIKVFNDEYEHISNEDKLIILPSWEVFNNEQAIDCRDKSIELGFEGLILRNPDAEYQYGKRNMSMIKFKRSTDGKFLIKDIIPEGIKRKHIPLFVCQNDVNDATFECHVCGSQEYQANVLKNKDKYIGKFMYVEYGERSGVNQLPFHVKNTYIINT